MSLPQTEPAVPPGEHASVNVCPTFPFSDVAFACQVVGVPLPPEDGGAADDEPGLELSGAPWPPPPPLLSCFSFEQPALPSTTAANNRAPQRRVIRRSTGDND